MARDIQTIKKEMTDLFMAEEAVQEKYGFGAGESFDTRFSKVSVEGLLFYVTAFAVWVLEKLFDSHKEEVDNMLGDRLPHTTRWYRNLVLSFIPAWADEPVVKHCSVDDRGSRVRIKIAGGAAGARAPVDETAYNAVVAYLSEEKDAGLKIDVVNEDSCSMSASLRVWYDPMVLMPSGKPVEAALREYVSSLDFDGLLTRNDIVEALRSVPGVKVVKIESLKTKYASNAWRDFGNQERPESGYWSIADADMTVVYERYRKENL